MYQQLQQMHQQQQGNGLGLGGRSVYGGPQQHSLTPAGLGDPNVGLQQLMAMGPQFTPQQPPNVPFNPTAPQVPQSPTPTAQQLQPSQGFGPMGLSVAGGHGISATNRFSPMVHQLGAGAGLGAFHGMGSVMGAPGSQNQMGMPSGMGLLASR